MNRYLAALDRKLSQRGETILLRRTVGTTNQSFVQCELKAIVKPFTVEPLSGGISIQNFFIIISPTHIINQKWPGGKPPPPTGGIISPVDPRIPTVTDSVFLRGAQKQLQRVAPKFDRDECIRIEMTVLG